LILWTVLAWVVLARLAELALARRNERRLRARGAVEHGAGHYPLFFLLHGGWLLAVAALADPYGAPVWGWLAMYGVLQVLRVWIVASLGPYWTTRVLTPPAEPLVRRGPYRWLRHPNYLVVAGEIAALPLAFRLWTVALVFSALNLALLAWRIRIEEEALAPRRRTG
jgi:methyltransferase